MKYFIKIMLLIGTVAISQFVYSDSITDSYATGDTLTAGTMDNIKSAVNDNDTRLTALESVIGGVPSLSGYSLPFSADGAPKNVVVLARDNNNGTTWYNVQVRYANSSVQTSVEGALVIRPYIADWYSINVDAGGNLISVANFVEAPLTMAYVDFVMEDSTFDVNTLAKTVTRDIQSEVWDCSGGGGAISECDVDVRINGVSDNARSYTAMRVARLLGSGSINSIQYDNLRGEHRTYITGVSYRVRAGGIGEVMRLTSGQKARKAIYYRVNGNTGGSLVGTPFAAGGNLDGVLF